MTIKTAIDPEMAVTEAAKFSGTPTSNNKGTAAAAIQPHTSVENSSIIQKNF